MGNLHSNRELEIVNPVGNPFQHIVPIDFDKKGQVINYGYLPSLEGLTIRLGRIQGLDFESFKADGSIKVSFLPPIEKVPPPEYRAFVLVEEAIKSISEEIVNAANADVNAFYCSHGSQWGELPEEVIRTNLLKQGITVLSGSFPRVGGRKRIQEHAVIVIH